MKLETLSWATSSPPASLRRSAAERSAVGIWILGAALVVFAAYTANFLYFFVDDEGIPLVYAQHLLRGHGLIYNSLEGLVEGYTNFLHVMLDTELLAGVRALGWPKLSVFFLGKACRCSRGSARSS